MGDSDAERNAGASAGAGDAVARRAQARAAESAERERVEQSLLQRIAERDRPAFDALYRIYFPRLTRFLDRMTRLPHVVEEVLDDTMIVVWERPTAFNGRSKVSTWIFGIADRKALKALRAFDAPVESDADETWAPSEGAPENLLQRRQVGVVLVEALARLSPEQRAVVELTYFHECAYGEIAQIVDCPVDTVKTRMFHARRRLRAMLSDRQDELQ
jgi:RNA polymerase sigma factor (sigma-70 family)